MRDPASARDRAALPLALTAVVLLTSGCGLLAPAPEPPGSGGSAAPSVPSARPTGIGGAEDAGYDASCTGEGGTQVRGSARARARGGAASDGAVLLVALAWTTADPADGNGRVALQLQSTRAGSASERVEGLGVGDEAHHESWTVTVRSVCADAVGVDVRAEG